MTQSLELTVALDTQRLRDARARLGWSQRELARRCGIGDAQINKYEGGLSDPSSVILKRIAEVLDLSTDYLLGLTDDPHGHLGDGELKEDERAMLEAYRRAGWPGVARLMADMMEK
jgi:transcriptional regulator with XRE-family HTH domain